MKHSEKLGNHNINKLLVELSVPSVIGMLAVSIYHIADTIFIGHGVGSMAIAGVAVALPLLFTLNVFGHAIGIGGASIVSRALGAGNKEKAVTTLNNLLLVILVINIVFYTIAYSFLELLLTVFGANYEIMPYAYDYAKIALIGSFSLNILFVVMNIIRAEGNAKFPMKVQLMAAGLNVILNPIFIFVFHWGVTGAAIATSISQFIGAFLAILYFSGFKKSELYLKLNLVFTKPDFSIIKECFAIGASSFARQSATAVMIIALNNALMLYSGSMGVAAFGIIYRLAMFIFMPLFGINQGFMPIAGYNYGAKKNARVFQVLKIAVFYSTALCILALAGFWLFSTQLILMFTTDPQLIEIASAGLKIVIIAFPVIGFQIIGSGLFQSLGKAWAALFLALSRQVLFLIPLIIILPSYLGINGIWYSFPAADVLAAVITAVMVGYQLRKIRTETESEIT